MPFANAVSAAIISTSAVGQSLFQQLCDSPETIGFGLTLMANRESAGVSRLIFDLAASYATLISPSAKYGCCAVADSEL